jgi:predicted nucleotidyltransferase
MLHIKSSDGVTIKSVQYDALLHELTLAAKRIKEAYPTVARVLLFGSFAKGNYTPESDVDVVIIVKQIDAPFIKRGDAFLKVFSKVPFDLNIMVYTEAEIEKMLGEGNCFIKNVLKEAWEL